MKERSDSAHLKGQGERKYRQLVKTDLVYQRVTVQETDLSIYTDVSILKWAREAVYEQRGYIESYIRSNPDFAKGLTPFCEDFLAPPIVQEMIQASRRAKVGPMAAVAGAVAEKVGASVLRYASEVIIENGGDIFIAVNRPITVAVYAGASPLSLKSGLRVMPNSGIHAVCTSSGSIGHSLSLGRADAVCVLSNSCALADAVATAVGNRVARPSDITSAIEWGQSIEGVHGILVIIDEKMGAWGQIELVAL